MPYLAMYFSNYCWTLKSTCKWMDIGQQVVLRLTVLSIIASISSMRSKNIFKVDCQTVPGLNSNLICSILDSCSSPRYIGELSSRQCGTDPVIQWIMYIINTVNDSLCFSCHCINNTVRKQTRRTNQLL